MPGLSNEELCARVAQGDDAAKEQLILQNRGYIYRLTDRLIGWHGCQYPEDDVSQIGYLELLRVAEKFDSGRGNKFLTYAEKFILSAMEKELLQQLNSVNAPPTRYRNIRRAYAVYTNSGEASEKEKIAAVCAAMNISEEKAEKYLLEHQSIHPQPLHQNLDASVKDVWNAPLDPYLIPPEPYIMRKENIRWTLSFIAENLSVDQLDILKLYYGIGHAREHNFEEIAKILMVKPATASKAHSKAIKKLSKMYTDDNLAYWNSIRRAIRESKQECILARNDLGRYDFPQEYTGVIDDT